jgi:hypothetical protein
MADQTYRRASISFTHDGQAVGAHNVRIEQTGPGTFHVTLETETGEERAAREAELERFKEAQARHVAEQAARAGSGICA